MGYERIYRVVNPGKKEQGSQNNFIGKVLLEKLTRGPKSPQMRAVFVEFGPGAYTKLHHHTGDQVLYVTEGEGFIESADGKKQTLRPGVRVVIPAGQLHRHGATANNKLVHLAVTIGRTCWWTADAEPSHS